MESNESKKASQLIDLNGKTSPAVLASMLGINVSMVYQGRQDGKFPPNSDATYRECITYYANYWKTKSASKTSNLSEAVLIQKMKLDAAKTENEWLNNKQKKMELIDIKVIAETFEPIFLHIRSQLVSIARKFPDVQATIDKALEEWEHLGETLSMEGSKDLANFIDTKMNEELYSPEECEDDSLPLSSFDDYVPLPDSLL